MEKIEAEVRLTANILKKAYTYYYTKVQYKRVRIFVPVIIALVAIQLALYYKNASEVDLLSTIVPLLVVGAFLFFIPNINGNRMANQSMKVALFKQPIQYVFTPNKIIVTTELSESASQWKMYNKAFILEYAIILVSVLGTISVIPTEAVKKEDLFILESWVRSNIDDVVE